LLAQTAMMSPGLDSGLCVERLGLVRPTVWAGGRVLTVTPQMVIQNTPLRGGSYRTWESKIQFQRDLGEAGFRLCWQS